MKFDVTILLEYFTMSFSLLPCTPRPVGVTLIPKKYPHNDSYICAYTGLQGILIKNSVLTSMHNQYILLVCL